jgi:molybdate transport system substrate-binding protein
VAGRPGGRRIAAALLSTALALAGLVAACSLSSTLGDGAATELTVFAAASLRDPLESVAAAYEAASGVRLVVATDSSTALRIQVEEGARADVFLSADTTNPEVLASAGLTDGEIVAFAGNPLAIVVPAGNPAGFVTPADLARPGIAIVAAAEGVPVTAYATELLERLASLPGYPRNLPAAYAANVVTREDNVQAALAKIELGEGDAAIVYATDATRSDAVDTVAIPTEANVTATYAGVVLLGAADRTSAHAFFEWLAGPAGQAILAAYGFVAAP